MLLFDVPLQEPLPKKPPDHEVYVIEKLCVDRAWDSWAACSPGSPISAAHPTPSDISAHSAKPFIEYAASFLIGIPPLWSATVSANRSDDPQCNGGAHLIDLHKF